MFAITNSKQQWRVYIYEKKKKNCFLLKKKKKRSCEWPSYIQGGAERMTNFEMGTIQHQGERHMSGRYCFGRGILAFFSSNIFFSISGEAMVPWTIEHRVFAYDSYVKNNESITAVKREFRRRFNIHRNQSIPTHNIIVRWVNALYTQGTLLDWKLAGALWTARIPENVERVWQTMLRSPNRSVWRIWHR